MIPALIFVNYLLSYQAYSLPVSGDQYSDFSTQCDYRNCPKIDPSKLNVHLIPHSHNDVGWLKTVDQYYYGSATRYQRAGIQYILDSVIRELQVDPNRRFIWVETAYLSKWWKEQTPATKDVFTKLVETGKKSATLKI